LNGLLNNITQLHNIILQYRKPVLALNRSGHNVEAIS